MKKAIALFISALLVLACFASCSENGDVVSSDEKSNEETAESSYVSSEPVSEAPTDPLAHIEQQDMDRDIVFLVVGDDQDRYRSVEIMPNEFSPELISLAVAERNAKVEERLGVRISEVRANGGDMVSMMRSNSMADVAMYDVVMPYLYMATGLTTEKAFYDLHDFDDTLRLDELYWNPNAQAALSIDNKLYFCTGDFSLLSFECTHAIVFNKTLLNKASLESPYALVESGNWTLDKLEELSKAVTAETDGEDGITFKDTIGFWVDSDFSISLYMASGERMSSKDNKDIPVITLGTERAATVIDKVVGIINDASSSLHIETIQNSVVSLGYKDCYYYATEAFANGRALFRSLSLVDLHELSDFEVDYGILPPPKYDSAQDKYYCFGSSYTVTAAAIPTSVKEPEKVALVLEAMAAASESTVKYNYYEVLLKSRKIQDLEGESALDTIFANRVYDLADIYNWGSVREMLFNVLSKTPNTYASSLASSIDRINTAMNDTISFFEQ